MNLKPYPKYKDSGIEWLGKVPVGWEVKKLVFKSATGSGKTIMMADDSKEKLLAEIERSTSYAKNT